MWTVNYVKYLKYFNYCLLKLYEKKNEIENKLSVWTNTIGT